MGANFIVNDGKITNLDKLIIVFNFHGLNEVLNQGFCYSKTKIKDKTNIAGVWRLKRKNNAKTA